MTAKRNNTKGDSHGAGAGLTSDDPEFIIDFLCCFVRVAVLAHN